MSRAPPFPSRRAPQDSLNGSYPYNAPVSAGGSLTRPLQVSRGPVDRPTTPSNSLPSNPAQGGPSRPQRSELRYRQQDSTSDRPSYYRDSYSSETSSYSRAPPPRNAPMSASPMSRPRAQQSRNGSMEEEQTSPTMNNVMSAFKSAGRRRAMTNGSDDAEFQREREQAREEERARQKRIQNKTPGRRVNGKARAGDIDAVLDQIKDGWEFVIDPDFNTVELALQLLDNDSPLGKDMESFRRTKNMLSRALKGSVDKYYQAFASSLPHHASLLNSLIMTETQIDESRTALQEAKDSLGSRRTDLVQLWSRGQTLEEMMKLLDQIERLKAVPDHLETLMSEKRLLQAAVLLVRSLKIINKPEMVEIGAVADLRSYLNGQETALREILIDELHGHLYLKSYWCETRWSAYVPNQRTMPKPEFEDERGPEPKFSQSKASPSSPTFRQPQTRLNRFIHDLTLRSNEPPFNLNDPDFRSSQNLSSSATTSFYNSSGSSEFNPEMDSFSYMETILESLAVLGRLGSALDSVAQRLTTEIYNLVETTIEEVSERAEFVRKSSLYNAASQKSEGVYVVAPSELNVGVSAYVPGSSLRLSALESIALQAEHEVLRDFFWTLYSKLDAVAQGLRVTYETANRISSRREFKDTSGAKPGTLFPLDDVWLTVQAEIRTLIYDYLTNEEQGSASGRNPISSINEILKEGRFTRDKNKSVFRFADTDVKVTSKALKNHEEGLNRALKDTMPGLVQGSAETTVQAALSNVGADERLLGAGQHHRLLIKPDAFHVSVLFQPTLSFLECVSEVLPLGVDSLRATASVLEEFVLKIYLPQLEDKVSILFHSSSSGHDAFQIDPFAKQLSPEPIVKSSTHLMALINSLRVMLQTTPFHRDNYSRLMLSVIIQYYQRCSDHFQDLVSITPTDGSETHVAMAAAWAQRSELGPCMSELLADMESDVLKVQQLCKQETNLEIDFLGQHNLESTDLVPSLRNLLGLASLYRSVMWFAAELGALKPQEMTVPATPLTVEPISAISVQFAPLPIPPPGAEEQLNLPLSREMALRFQALVKTFEQLGELILLTIRIDIRCRAIYHLNAAFTHGNYSPEREASEPDPNIVEFNAELSQIDDMLASAIPKRARDFVFVGLGYLMEQVLIWNAKRLKKPTSFGIQKIMRNILALQQGIKAITSDNQNSEFRKAKRYYSLFFVPPQKMLDSIREKQEFAFDEYETMLALQCGIDLNGARGSQAGDRNYSMYVIDLHGLEIEKT